MAAALAPARHAALGIATGAFPDERDDWRAAVARARAEGWRIVELTAITGPRLRALLPFLAQPGFLDGLDRVSVHAPGARLDTTADACCELLSRLPHDVVLHPDVYGDAARVADLGPRAVFENMDAAKAFGRALDDLRTVFERFPEAGLCLDVAHVWTNDRTLRLGHELLDALGDRLRQLHVSGIEPDGTHRPTTPSDLELYAPLLDRCRDVPWLLEAVLAEGPTA